MFKKIIMNIIIAFYSNGVKLWDPSIFRLEDKLNPTKIRFTPETFETSIGLRKFDDSNIYENNSKYNLLKELKKERKDINNSSKDFIMEKIKKYYNENNLDMLSNDNTFHSIAILFIDW